MNDEEYDVNKRIEEMQEETAKRTIFEIPAENMESLEKKIAKMNNKALKLFCEPITLNVLEFFDKKVDKQNYVRYNRVEIIGKAPIINGWELIATCEQKENGTMIRTIPGKFCPTKYRSLMICEHCNSDRKRKYTFVVKNTTTNDYKMVGRACLKDFLGSQDPAFIASYMEYIIEPDIKEFGGHGSGCYRCETKEYLRYVSACIRENGWVSKTMAYEQERLSTSSQAEIAMNARYNSKLKKEDFPQPTDGDDGIVEDSLKWATNLPDLTNSYLYNINLLAKEKTIKYSDIGFVASIVSSYNRSLETEEERKAKVVRKERQEKLKVTSDYYGEVGDKVKIELIYIVSFSFEGQYGTQYIHKFADATGNVFVWKTTNDLGYWDESNDGKWKETEQNDKVVLKGTIKEQKEYNGERQTVLTRCKMQ